MKAWTYLAAAALIPSMFVACGDDRRGGGSSSVCDDICDCEQCTDVEKDECEAQEDAIQSQADAMGCSSELDDYFDCVSAGAECIDMSYVVPSDCLVEQDAYSACVGQGGCPSVGDGVCDEPEGTGTCPEGTDAVDCSGGCPYTNNGQCDEPEGSGLCPEGTDVVDCSASGCPYTNDGQCDEPEGTGLCPEGTDVADCSGSGTCDSQGVCGDANTGCLGCALSGNCAGQLATCQNNVDCTDYVTCLNACADQACADQCAVDHPTGASLYNDLVICAICQECPVSCDGPGSGCP